MHYTQLESTASMVSEIILTGCSIVNQVRVRTCGIAVGTPSLTDTGLNRHRGIF